MDYTVCFVILLLLVFFYIVSKCDTKEDNTYREYKIPKHKKKTVDDEFNLKEFDTMNENIVIHNKFKNELLDHKEKKHNREVALTENKYKEQERLHKEINANSKIVMKKELDKRNKSIKQDNKFIKNNIKNEINNFLIDYKAKRATKDDIISVVAKINEDINNTFKYIDSIQLNYVNIPNNDYYIEAPMEKINLLNKKKRIYVKLINSI